MLKFEAIADGNCLYNAEAIFLVQSFLDNKLEPLFKNKDRLAQFHQILLRLQANNVITVAKNPTIQAVKVGLSRLIAKFSTNGVINWRDLQFQVAQSLREYVQDTVIKDEVINQQVRVSLTRALDQCIDMAYLNNHDTQNVLPKNINIEGIDGSHFEGMQNIVHKIKEVLENDSLHSPELKKIALSEWFFDGEAVGFGEYLQGENGIGNNAIHTGDIELNVLSAKLGIVHKTFMRGAIGNEQSATYYHAFKANEDARKVAEDELIFAFEKTADHWNCLFADTPENNAWIAAHEQQLLKSKIENFVAEHGGLEAHRNSLGLSIEEYCLINGISDVQFKENCVAPNKSAVADTHISVVAQSKKSEPKIAAATTQNPNPAKLSNPPTVTQPVLVKEVDDKKLPPVSSKEEIAVPKLTPTMQAKTIAPKSQNYWKYFATAALALVFLSHCLVMPILQAAFAGFSHLSLLGVAALTSLSVLGGYAYAEKMHSAPLSSNLITNQCGDSIVASVKPTMNSVIDLQNTPPTFVAYYNTQAQEQKREQHSVMEGRPKGPRQKLH